VIIIVTSNKFQGVDERGRLRLQAAVLWYGKRLSWVAFEDIGSFIQDSGTDIA